MLRGIVFLKYYGYFCNYKGKAMETGKKEYKVIRIKGENGTTYLYEDRSYWDKEKGYSTHDRKCIGKLDADGKPVYNGYYRDREKIQKLEKKVQEIDTASTTTLMGQRLVLEKEVKRTGVSKPLAKVFGKEDAARILALAFYDICRGKAFGRSPQWLEDRGFGELGLSTQRISELLGRLDHDRINTFLKEWLGREKPSSRLLFDITSVSTYGKSNPYAEYGYNRDREHLPQINLALLSSCKTGLPLWYKDLKGSMSDKAVLGEVLDELDKYDVRKFTFVGDRGFYTAENLRNLAGRGIKFLIPIPSSIKLGKDLIAEHRGSLVSPGNVIKGDDGGAIYGKTVYRKTEYGRTWFHIYYDPVRRDKIVAGFMEKLRSCMDDLVAGTRYEAHKDLYDKYFIVTDTPKRGRKVSYNDAALREYLDGDSCYWVLMGMEKKTAAEALSDYRERGGVELSFDDIKNLLDLNRLRNHSDATIRGKIFVNFIALIILSSLRRTVDAIPEKDRKYWSESDMLDKVETYAKVHFTGKYKDIFTTPTKTQRLVFDLLGIPYVYKGEPQNDDLTPPEEL